MKVEREDWFEGQLDLDPDTLVFIDETGATTAMARCYGRAPRGERCRTYIADLLVPTLNSGDIVILDNLPAHKVVGVRDAIQAAGARRLYLPPYSLDFNPTGPGLRQAQGAAPLRRSANRP